jgi:diguanylate cyclase (GGDEF)-like protein
VDILREAGHNVTALADPRDAVTVLRGGRFDLLITDLVLPHMNGLQLLELGRALARPVDIIVVTGHATVRNAVAALKAGAFDYITKPVQAEELLLTCSRALAQRRLLDENNELKATVALFQRSQAIAASLERPHIERLAVEAFMEELGCQAGAWIGHDERGRVELRFGRNITSDCGDVLLKRVAGVSGLVVFDKIAAEVPEVREVLGPAMLAPSGPDAIFVARGAGDLPFDFTERVKADFLAKHVALALENAGKLDQAKELAYVDDLTSLYNSRYLEHVLDKEIERSDEEGKPLSVVFLDLDHFKSVNDTHGHLVGSRLLVEVAEVIKRCCRPQDIVVRYGGDEYTVILPDTDASGASAVAERIRQSIEEECFLGGDGPELHLTASIGVAAVPEDARDKREVLRLADLAMYYAKEKKRNAVYSARDLQLAADAAP